MFRWLLMVSTDNKPELTVRSSSDEAVTAIAIFILLFIVIVTISVVMYETISSLKDRIAYLEKKIEEISPLDKTKSENENVNVNEKSDE